MEMENGNKQDSRSETQSSAPSQSHAQTTMADDRDASTASQPKSQPDPSAAAALDESEGTMPTINNNGAAATTATAEEAMNQREQDDEEDQQQIMEARLLMQQRQADESLLAVAMARASNNMMSSGTNPYPEAFLYQQALLNAGQRGTAGVFPGHPFYGGVGGGIPPEWMTGVSSQQLQRQAQGDMASGVGASPPKDEAASSTKQSTATKEEEKRASDDGDGTDSDNSQSETTTEAKTNFKKTRPNYAKSSKRPYFDASTEPDPGTDEEESDDEIGDDGDKHYAKARQNESFPKKLYRMIEDAESNGKDDIISFLPHGRAFIIHKPREFISEIMPLYFTTTRMSSFQRQLNLYGFRRITEGRDKSGYYHEYFLKGRKGLVKKIRRKKPSTPKTTSQEELDMAAAQISNDMLLSTYRASHLPLSSPYMGPPPPMQLLPHYPHLAMLYGGAASSAGDLGGMSLPYGGQHSSFPPPTATSLRGGHMYHPMTTNDDDVKNSDVNTAGAEPQHLRQQQPPPNSMMPSSSFGGAGEQSSAAAVGAVPPPPYSTTSSFGYGDVASKATDIA